MAKGMITDMPAAAEGVQALSQAPSQRVCRALG